MFPSWWKLQILQSRNPHLFDWTGKDTGSHHRLSINEEKAAGHDPLLKVQKKGEIKSGNTCLYNLFLCHQNAAISPLCLCPLLQWGCQRRSSDRWDRRECEMHTRQTVMPAHRWNLRIYVRLLRVKWQETLVAWVTSFLMLFPSHKEKGSATKLVSKWLCSEDAFHNRTDVTRWSTSSDPPAGSTEARKVEWIMRGVLGSWWSLHKVSEFVGRWSARAAARSSVVHKCWGASCNVSPWANKLILNISVQCFTGRFRILKQIYFGLLDAALLVHNQIIETVRYSTRCPAIRCVGHLHNWRVVIVLGAVSCMCHVAIPNVEPVQLPWNSKFSSVARTQFLCKIRKNSENKGKMYQVLTCFKNRQHEHEADFQDHISYSTHWMSQLQNLSMSSQSRYFRFTIPVNKHPSSLIGCS